MPASQHRGVYLGDVWMPSYADDQKRTRMLGSPLVDQRGQPPVPVAIWEPHELMSLLLVAQTGGGKTTLLRVVVDQLTKDGVPKVMLLCDGKEVGTFYLFGHHAGVKPVNDKDQIVDEVAGVAAEVARRKQLLARARKEAASTGRRVDWWEPFIHIYLVIDDYMGWLLLLDEDQVKQVLRDLSVIAFQGRELKIHLVLALQTAHSKILDVGLSPQLKLSIDARVVCPGDKGLAAVQAGMLFDDRTAAQRIPRLKGGGLYRVGTEEVEFNVPNFPDWTDPETDLTDEEVARLSALTKTAARTAA